VQLTAVSSAVPANGQTFPAGQVRQSVAAVAPVELLYFPFGQGYSSDLVVFSGQ
jgi:hypothetical protein